jgi:methionyl-tRNA synthetase
VVPGRSAAAEITTADKELDAAFIAEINELLAAYRSSMDSTKLRGGLVASMAISARGNQYLQDNTLDNALLANRPDRCATVLLHAVNLIYIMSAIFHPFMPSTTDSILVQLNAPARTIPSEFSIEILPGHKVGKPDHLFKRIDPSMEVEWRNKFGGGTKSDSAAAAAAAPTAVVANGTAGGMSKSQLEKQKRAQKKAEAAALEAAMKEKMTPEMRQLDEKIVVQGARVRDLKIGKAAGDVDAEVKDLLAMKAEMASLVKAMKETTTTV